MFSDSFISTSLLFTGTSLLIIGGSIALTAILAITMSPLVFFGLPLISLAALGILVGSQYLISNSLGK